MKPILEVKGIRKSYGSATILDGISFSMLEGERICLLGPSGCGKSTLLQIIAGLLEADDGVIHMDGLTVNRPGFCIPPEKRPINMVFQDYALWPHMTIRDNIEYGLRRKKFAPALRNARVSSVTELLQLKGLLARIPAELSGGQQQRVGIARALATEPRILLMDEPLSNLDVKLRTEMRNELAEMLSLLSITAIYITHDMMEAFALAHRILVLHSGRIEQLASPQQLFEAPATPWVAELMGYHNRLEGELVGIEGDEAIIRCNHNMIRGMISSEPEYRPVVGDKVVMMLHMETISVQSHSEDTLSHDTRTYNHNQLHSKVKRIIYEGNRWRYMLETADGQCLQALSTDIIEAGSEVCLTFPVLRTRVYSLQPVEQVLELSI